MTRQAKRRLIKLVNIDRYMVNLFFEIKRNLPKNLQKDLKISNPNLGQELIDLYVSLEDAALKRLIEVFLDRAGEDWSKQLKSVTSKKSLKALLTKKTRTELGKSVPPAVKTSPKVRYYRGALIDA